MSNIGNRFVAYISGIPGVKESKDNGSSYLSIPQSFFNEPDDVLSPGDIAQQTVKARRLNQILEAADKAFDKLSKNSPHINKNDLLVAAIDRACKEVK